MNDYQLVAFDLDGTTIPMGGTTASDRFCNCVQEGLLQGVVFAPFTGRTITTIPSQILEIPGIRYLSYANGAGIYDTQTKSYLYHQLMDLQTCLDILRYLRLYNLPVMVFSDGRVVMERQLFEDSEQYLLPAHHKKAMEDGYSVVVEDMEQYLTEHKPNIDKINIARVLGESRTQISTYLLQDDRICVVSSGGVNLEINDIRTSKGNALEFLATHLGIGLENVMALGDNDNDVSMLKVAGLGVAVDNASDSARAAANHITDSQDCDGAALAIERFVLSKNAIKI